MITLNITLHGMHDELESACAKMKGTYDKALNRCQLDVTDSLSKVVKKVLTTKPKDKKAEDHQVSFAKHAPAVFFGCPEVRNSPATTVVLRRVFEMPTASRARPWSHNFGMRRRVPRSAYYPPPYPPPYYPQAYPYAMPSMASTYGYPMPASQPCNLTNCACGGRKSTNRSRRQPGRVKAAPAHTVVRKHRRRRRASAQQRGGGGGSIQGMPCYQYQACANHNQRYLYDAQGQQGCMQPLAQGGQRYVFPTAVVPVMAPSYYPANGPVGYAST